MSDSWKDPEFAKEYADNANNTDTNWYEHFINAASLWSLIPTDTKNILDFGCGPGNFTAQLKEKGYTVEGCDGSEAMVELAKKTYPDIKFFVWDGASTAPATDKYDTVITKLTLHFIEDLNAAARNLSTVLKAGGNIIISVPHPVSTIPKAHGEYFKQTHYDTEIGSYGMQVKMIHRSVQDYITPFLENGYVMTGIAEPNIDDKSIEKYSVTAEYAAVPRRLNLRFQKLV